MTDKRVKEIRERPGWAFLKGKVPITPEERDLIFAHIDTLEAENGWLKKELQDAEAKRPCRYCGL